MSINTTIEKKSSHSLSNHRLMGLISAVGEVLIIWSESMMESEHYFVKGTWRYHQISLMKKQRSHDKVDVVDAVCLNFKKAIDKLPLKGPLGKTEAGGRNEMTQEQKKGP
ncbi:hypothetical protein chiPu_0025486 [Chiloscyllium punctatum]|uniref:Uncharacterized protein n=1 Tax=Chiloscyllium punctatum TaxID=137246 RepID=A0A401TF33_CHIPU|nr:hypothetical protein [Chiloscyllium punctatum]